MHKLTSPLRILYVQPITRVETLCSIDHRRILAKKGHRVMVLSWRKKGNRHSRHMISGVEVFLLRGLNIQIPFVKFNNPLLSGLLTIALRFNPDIVHIHGHLSFATCLQALFVAKILRKPVVITVHGTYAARGRMLEAVQRFYLKTIGRIIFSLAHRIICLTGSDAKEIVSLGVPRRKIVIIPNGVDIDWYKPRRKSGKNEIVLWAGRLVPEKGIQHLLKAWSLVIKQKPDAKLYLAGTGPLKIKLKVMCKYLGIQNSVKWYGYIPWINMRDFLHCGSIFVFTSTKEGMPFAILEAMASGLCVVATDIPGINSVIRDGYSGILVPTSDVKGLAKALVDLMSNKDLLRSLAKTARREVKREYDWSLIANKLLRIYQEVLLEYP